MAEAFNPEVASVIPVLNEADSIIDCLDSLCNQTYPAELHHIYVFDGGSTDNTVQVIEQYISMRQEQKPTLHLHNNPGKYVAEARNLALELIPDSVEYFVEIIGHCTVEIEHIERLVATMGKLQTSNDYTTGALGVSVVPRRGELGQVESWIEAALSSPIARGKGQFDKFTGIEETNVPAFCLHYRKALHDVGGWDSTFITSQDSDLSMRMKKCGYQLFRSASIQVQMAKRTTLSSWSKMGFRYGFWRTKLVRRHANRLSLRELLPWFGLITTLLMLGLGFIYWYIPIVLYLAVLFSEGIRATLNSMRISHLLGVPLAITILHTSFSVGLLYGLFGKPKSFNDRESNSGNIN